MSTKLVFDVDMEVHIDYTSSQSGLHCNLHIVQYSKLVIVLDKFAECKFSNLLKYPPSLMNHFNRISELSVHCVQSLHHFTEVGGRGKEPQLCSDNSKLKLT